MISKNEILMGRDLKYPLNKSQLDNLQVLFEKINKVRSAYGKPMIVSSGYRPSEINSKVPGAAKNSSHTMCMAVDIQDLDGSFKRWVFSNLQLFKDLDLYIEDFRWTKTWVHIQTRKASRRIFIPYSDQVKNPMTSPNCWDGKYDSKYD